MLGLKDWFMPQSKSRRQIQVDGEEDLSEQHCLDHNAGEGEMLRWLVQAERRRLMQKADKVSPVEAANVSIPQMGPVSQEAEISPAAEGADSGYRRDANYRRDYRKDVDMVIPLGCKFS